MCFMNLNSRGTDSQLVHFPRKLLPRLLAQIPFEIWQREGLLLELLSQLRFAPGQLYEQMRMHVHKSILFAC